jgi:metallophosphoesterase (TIGR03767 family)
MPDPSSTLARTIVPGDVLRHGRDAPYRRLTYGAGEPHLLREDLGAVPPTGTPRPILRVAHLSDLQIADVQSPLRMEFLESVRSRAGVEPYLPAQRPHETLVIHAVQAMLERIARLPASPAPGAGLDLVVTTGDAIDNRQWNELRWFLALMDGGDVRPAPGGGALECVQAWGGSAFWQPEGVEEEGYAGRWGFPSVPGLLLDAGRPFAADGLGVPWLACFGNHEALVQGMAVPTAEAGRLAVGERKSVAPRPAFDPAADVIEFIRNPARLLAGPARAVRPDPSRRFFTRREFIEAHLRSPGLPAGHGFTSENLERGTAYYAYDGIPGVRIVVLDTSNPGGEADGSIGSAQARWLEERLIECHATFLDDAGIPVPTGHADRPVMLASHHGLDTLANDLVEANPFDADALDLPRLNGPAIRTLLHRFPNVVAWLNGHTHEHRVVPRPDPARRTTGFWEITTGSIMDWPVQGRLIELVDRGDGSLSVASTMLDHAAPLVPPDHREPGWLASLHRELASNDPFLGATTAARGEPGDRNVELVWPGPR